MGDILVVFVAVVVLGIFGTGATLEIRRHRRTVEHNRAVKALEDAHERRLAEERKRHFDQLREWDEEMDRHSRPE